MSKSKFLRKNILFLAVTGVMIAGSSHASLYVSPVTKDSASVNYVGNVVNGNSGVNQQYNFPAQQQYMQQQVNQRNYQQQNVGGYQRGLTSTGDLFAQAMQQDSRNVNPNIARNQNGNVGFGMSVYNQSPTILMNQGKDIPLFVAIEGIIPDVNSWTVHYDEGMHNLDMTWSGGDTWEGVLNTLALQNNISVEINHAERVVGLGKNANIAKHLAKKVPTVWRVDTKQSLRENLTEWAEKAGWTLAWDKNLMIDYPIEQGAVFTGDLVGEGGAVDSILSSLKGADVPLKAKFYKKNKVVLVVRGGFEQELSY